MIPWVLLLLLAAVRWVDIVETSTCNNACDCKWKGGKWSAFCREKGLLSVPVGLPQGLQVIDLEKNNFHSLPSKIFQERGLVNLQRIYMSKCRLGSISSDAFQQLTNLVELDLSSNLLTTVPTEALKQARSLRKLQLHDNPIATLSNKSLEGLDHLTFLSLAECQLHSIDIGAFDGLDSLEYLLLERNRLVTLRAETVSVLPRIQELRLNNNPWNCDCNLSSLRKWMAARNIAMSVSPRCKSPERIEDIPWSDLDLSDFACLPEVLGPNDLFVSVEEGNNITMTCRIRSYPSATIRWEPASWYNESSNLDPERFIVRNEETMYGHQASVLNVNVAFADDMGTYMCIAENKAGSVTANFTLQVFKPISSSIGMSKTSTLGLILGFIVVALLIGTTLCIVVFRQRSLTSTSQTKVPPSNNFLKQLAIVKSVKGHPEVVQVTTPSTKTEYIAIAEKRLENGSSGYGSDQTPDLVSNKHDNNSFNKLMFEKDILYDGIGNGYINPVENVQYNQFNTALNYEMPRNNASFSEDYALGPLPAPSMDPMHPASSYTTASHQWAASSQQPEGYFHASPTQPPVEPAPGWNVAQSRPPNTRYSPDEGYAEEGLYEGTEV